MNTKKFTLDDIQVIEESEQLNDDQLSSIIGGLAAALRYASDCKCSDINCNVN